MSEASSPPSPDGNVSDDESAGRRGRGSPARGAGRGAGRGRHGGRGVHSRGRVGIRSERSFFGMCGAPQLPPQGQESHGWSTAALEPAAARRPWPIDREVGPNNIPWVPRSGKSILDYFRLFFTTEVLLHIADESELYAKHCRPHQFSSDASRMRFVQSFKPPSVSDILKLIAIYLIAGICRTASWIDLWDGVAANPYVMQLMSYREFLDLQGILHFGHGPTTLNKIDPLLSRLRANFRKHWNLGKWLVVDEGMVPFQGSSFHLSIFPTFDTPTLLGKFRYRMHLPCKPDSTGILFYILADCQGFMYDFYLAVGENRDEDPDGYRQLATVMRVTRFLEPGVPHCLVLDSYFGSEKLADVLEERGWNFVMGCRSDRPSYIWSCWLDASKQFIDGQPKYSLQEYRWLMREPGFLALEWLDKGQARLLCNMCKGDEVRFSPLLLE